LRPKNASYTCYGEHRTTHNDDPSGLIDPPVLKAAVLVAAGAALLMSLACGIQAFLMGHGGGAVTLEDTVNPNTASAGSLQRLPRVGPQRAQAIVQYRERMTAQRPGPVFRDIADLDAVPGLGPTTVQAMAPYLRFEEP
jgi:competence ComEA-like helix-hairpin-helix protein